MESDPTNVAVYFFSSPTFVELRSCVFKFKVDPLVCSPAFSASNALLKLAKPSAPAVITG